MDANLVVINSAEEQAYVQRNVQRNVQHDYWIGLDDRVEEGKWRWVDGTDYVSSVKFWASGQPHSTENEDEDCAVASNTGEWHDWPCSSIHFSICEKSA
uniref:hepatic lectin-like n=1 Tax=Pristiophorus japonicus TaxID=55135 RepID=UPI00398F7217